MNQLNQFNQFNRSDGIALFIGLAFLLVSTLLGLSALKANIFSEKMTHNTILREQAFEAAEIALIEGEQFAETFADQISTKVFYDNGSSDLIDETDPEDSGYQTNNDGDDCTVVVDGHGGICMGGNNTEAYHAAVGTTTNNGTGPIPYEHWVDIEGDARSQEVWHTETKHRTVDANIATAYGLNTAPRYIVEFTGFNLAPDGSSNCPIGGSGSDAADPDPDIQESWPFCYLDRKSFRITVLATAGNKDQVRVMLQSTFVSE